MASHAQIIPIDSVKKEEFQAAITLWVNNRRVADELSREEVGALEAFDRIDAMRKTELVSMAIFCRNNQRADAAFAVYHLIMMMADNDDGTCRISQTTMGAILGRSVKAIGETIKRLSDAGMIYVICDSGRSAKYVPVISRLTTCKNHRVWLIEAIRATPPLKVGGAPKTVNNPPAEGGGYTHPLKVGTHVEVGGGPPTFSATNPPAEGGTTSLIEFTNTPLSARARVEGDAGSVNGLTATAVVAAGIIAATAGLPAAATPVAQPPQIAATQSDELSACWRTPKATMAAALNTAEGRAQRQIWLTDSGIVGIGEQLKAELAQFFPLVDVTAGLMAAAPNVRTDHGAITCMQQVRRTFGYMQQDAVKQAARIAARNGGKQSQPVSQATPDQIDRAMWERRMELWVKNGRVKWPKDWGAPPGANNCQVPSEILEKHGFFGKHS